MAGMLADQLGINVLRETTAEHPFLTQVYEDGDRDDLSVELAFLLVHANPFRRLDRRRRTVCDFSPAKDQLFAEDMLDEGSLQLFRSVYEHLYAGHPLPDLVIYLRADPSLCLERVRTRMKNDPNRAFEAGMTVERLARMATRYEEDLNRLGRRVVSYDVQIHHSPDETAGDIVELLRQHSSSEDQGGPS